MEKRLAPAKVNLALDILGRRPDGYHELRSVMQTVSLCDTVELVEGGEGFTLSMAGFTPPEGKKTLEQRAAEAFFARLGRAMPPLTVRITKRSPAYAGLGGVSCGMPTPRTWRTPPWRPSARRWAATCPSAFGAARPWRRAGASS